MKIECQTCGWEGEDDKMVAQTSDVEPGCPGCGGTNFLDIEDEEGE